MFARISRKAWDLNPAMSLYPALTGKTSIWKSGKKIIPENSFWDFSIRERDFPESYTVIQENR